MQLRCLGKSDLKISPILMGTWQAGKDMWVGIDDARTTSAIRAAFEAGITTFDTAEMYGNGHSERVLGGAVSDFRDRAILAYSPMAQGLLTGKFAKDHKFLEGDHRVRNRLFKPENFQRVHQALDRLRPLAEEKKVSMGQLALAWVISHAGACAIAGARSSDQAVQNAAAAAVSLSDEELARLDEIGRLVTDSLDDDPIMWNF